MEYVFLVADLQPHTLGGMAAFPADNTGTLQTWLLAQGFRITTRDEFNQQLGTIPADATAETDAEFHPFNADTFVGDSDGLANKALAAPTQEGSATDAATPAPDIQDQIEAAHDTPPEDAAS